MRLPFILCTLFFSSHSQAKTQIAERTNYFLSPHLDDTVLTFGGLILKGTFHEKSNNVIVFFGMSNYTTNGPNEDVSDARVEYVTSTRMREDRSALTQIFGGWANYNYTLYVAKEATLRFFKGPKNAGGGSSGDFSSFRQAEIDAYEDAQKKVSAILLEKNCAVFVLSAVGSHIDHFIVREAVISAAYKLGDKVQCQIYFGEDQPYMGFHPESADKDMRALVSRLNLEAMSYSIPVEKKIEAFKAHYFSQYDDGYIKGLRARSALLQGGEQIYKWSRKLYKVAGKDGSCKKEFCVHGK